MTALALVTLIWVFVVSLDRISGSGLRAWVPLVLLGLGTVVFVSNWNTAIDDRTVYLSTYDALAAAKTPFDSSWSDLDPLFLVLLWVMSRTGVPVEQVAFFGVCGTVICLVICFSLWRLFGSTVTLFAFATLVATGFANAYAGIALRHGIALGISLFFIHLVRRGRPWFTCALVAAVAGGFHWSAWAATLVVFVVLRLNMPVRSVFLTWLVGASLLVSGFSESIVLRLGFASDFFNRYTSDAAYAAYGAGSGGRVDFLLFSALLGLVIWFLERSDVSGVLQGMKLTVTYFGLNLPFAFLGFVAYGDRIAIYSWVFGIGALWAGLVLRRDRIGDIVVPILVGGVILLGVLRNPWLL